MTTAGLFVMLISIGIVVSLFTWCVWKVLSTPNESEKLHSLEFETPDVKADS